MARFMGPTWGPPGSSRPQVGPMLAPRTLLSGLWKKGFPVPECYLQVAISSAARVHRDCRQTGVAGCGGAAGCPAGCSAGWRTIRAYGHTHSDMGICASASASRGVSLKDIRMTSHKRYSFSNRRPLDSLSNSLCRLTLKRTAKLRITGTLLGESTASPVVPLTKGQYSEKRFHVMMSSWKHHRVLCSTRV